MNQERYIEIIENEETISLYPLSCLAALVRTNNMTTICLSVRGNSFNVNLKESYPEVRNMVLGYIKTISVNELLPNDNQSDLTNVLPFSK